jgi:Ran GTPase-activating protein (RanGAP) involved in mRNA processing and transport
VDVNNVNMNHMNKNIELIGARAREVKIRSEMPPREVEKVKNEVKVGVLAVLAMLDVIREGDIVDAPRLNKIHQDEGEDGKKAKKVKLDKVKITDQQIDSDSDIIWFVQETGDTVERAKVKRVTGDAFDDEDTGEDEDDDDSKNSETPHDPENLG